MTISEQIKVLCVRNNISVSELARRLGTTPQNFNGKMRRESFSVVDMERIAEVTGTTFKREFILRNGETV
jgi:transcriptional regulator with XRE-family HTH domain